MAAFARRQPTRRHGAAVAASALVPLIALAAASLDGAVLFAAGRLFAAAAGLR